MSTPPDAPHDAPPDAGTDSGIEIDRTASAREAEERALVLRSVGIDHVQRAVDGRFLLLVAERDAARARDQLARFRSENAAAGAATAATAATAEGLGDGATPMASGWPAAALWSILLLGAWMVQLGHQASYPEIGRLVVERVRAGEVWRCVTALLVHTDNVHVLGNLVFGALFVFGAAQLFGSGIALFVTFFAGAIAYGMDAWLNGEAQAIVGASIGVLAALGFLSLGLMRARRGAAVSPAARIAPLVVALVLCGLLSNPDRRVDILGHLLGLVPGGLAGVLLGGAAARLRASRRAQAFGYVSMFLLIGTAWSIGVLAWRSA